jgi:hypothetical protein
LHYDDFIELLTHTQDGLINEAFATNGIEVKEVDDLVPVQVWLADGERAVFAIQNAATSTMSHGLMTSDPSFIEALGSMCDYYA